ncbi:DUF2793 domain-containing protein [Paenibacillus sp. NPDC056722]|uniref:DUF2793 domain-containing protein n=1 Tax=Paenibacillus sp. NPDC056722 TaxID=3345924 RepID=UPI0036983A8A
MAQTIQIKRGTKAELTTYGVLKAGELGFCIDTKEVFIGDGASNSMVGRALSGPEASRPVAGVAGRLYYVTSGTNNGYLYTDDGSAWRRVNPQKLSDLTGTLDDIADGTTYAKVLKTDVSGGHINKVSDGTNVKTAAEIKSHIDDIAKHRVINDTSNANTDLWSAQKIRNEIELAKRNIEPQASVKSQNVSTPPTNPVEGDRFIIPAGAKGVWTGKTNQIVEYQSSVWTYYSPDVGWTAYVDDEQKIYSWNGTTWVRTGGALQTITAGNGLTGGGQADTVTLNIGGGNGIAVNTNGISVTAGKGITVDAGGVSANVDGTSIVYDPSNSNRLMVASIDGGTF